MLPFKKFLGFLENRVQPNTKNPIQRGAHSARELLRLIVEAKRRKPNVMDFRKPLALTRFEAARFGM